jgi:predicted HTH domain antitoxin
MSVIIPDELIRAAGLTEQEMRLEIAVTLYDRAKLSVGKAAEVAGMDSYRFRQLLASRGFELDYDAQDFEDDLGTLRARLSGTGMRLTDPVTLTGEPVSR